MKIEIDAENFYRLLETPLISIQDKFFLEAIRQLKDGENWQGKDSAPISPQNFRLEGQLATLPMPFSYALPTLFKNNDFYSLLISLGFDRSSMTHTKIEDIMTQMPRSMGEKYKEQWIPLNNFGTGVILCQREPIIVISGGSTDIKIHLGGNGAARRKFSSLEDFAQNVLNLQKVTENYINSAIEIAVKEGVLPKNPDYTATIG